MASHSGENYDQMHARVTAKRNGPPRPPEGLDMAFAKKSATRDDESKETKAPPPFLKRAGAGKPVAKKSMRGNRGFAGGGR